MCVSAGASFGLSLCLAPAGIYCVKKAARQDRALLPLATIPLLFGVQQACEGLVWVGLDRQDIPLTRWAALAYSFFAFAFWLFWIPFSASVLDSRRNVRVVLGFLALLGALGGAAFYLPLLLDPDTLVVTVRQHSIRYDVIVSYSLEVLPQTVWQLAYLGVVGLPLLLVAKQRKGLVAFGAGIVVSAVVSHAFFWYAFASVWCFFAAALSVMLGVLFHRLSLVRSDLPEASLVSFQSGSL